MTVRYGTIQNDIIQKETSNNNNNKKKMCCGDDAVDEDKLILCCACCCVNCGLYPSCGCLGCSGKVGLLCCNCEFCCKPGAPCLPCGCCGPKCDCDDCAIMEAQCQLLAFVISAAFPCTDEVPCAVNALGCTVYPKCGCCMKQKAIMERD